MGWTQSTSRSFLARHDEADGADARLLLESLEQLRLRLGARFPTLPGELTLVLHGGSGSLALSNPLFPLGWAAASPAARRYVAGWAGAHELHVLAPRVLRARASAVPGSRQMLELTPAALYTRRVLSESNPDLPAGPRPGRVRAELRWSWLLEGGSRWFAGQTAHARPAIARRLREGGRPRFPPGPRDAVLLGGTVIDLLAAEAGEEAAVELVSRLHRQGPRVALVRAFRGRSLDHTEGVWRTHLARLAAV